LDYATGAILFQRNEQGKPRPIGYHSKTFSEAKCNYDIYDKELTAVDQGLENWRHLLLGSEVIVHTDHTNLTYYRHPHKLSDCTRRALSCIMKYNLTIKHKPGIHNRADALSCRPDYETCKPPEESIGLPDHLFICTISALDIDKIITQGQIKLKHVVLSLAQNYPLELHDNKWFLTGRLVVVGNNDFKRGVISLYHDFPSAGHPGG
jgi:hypothetical protein